MFHDFQDKALEMLPSEQQYCASHQWGKSRGVVPRPALGAAAFLVVVGLIARLHDARIVSSSAPATHIQVFLWGLCLQPEQAQGSTSWYKLPVQLR